MRAIQGTTVVASEHIQIPFKETPCWYVYLEIAVKSLKEKLLFTRYFQIAGRPCMSTCTL